jgi:hypothetical protein
MRGEDDRWCGRMWWDEVGGMVSVVAWEGKGEGGVKQF